MFGGKTKRKFNKLGRVRSGKKNKKIYSKKMVFLGVFAVLLFGGFMIYAAMLVSSIKNFDWMNRIKIDVDKTFIVRPNEDHSSSACKFGVDNESVFAGREVTFSWECDSSVDYCELDGFGSVANVHKGQLILTPKYSNEYKMLCRQGRKTIEFKQPVTVFEIGFKEIKEDGEE